MLVFPFFWIDLPLFLLSSFSSSNIFAYFIIFLLNYYILSCLKIDFFDGISSVWFGYFLELHLIYFIFFVLFTTPILWLISSIIINLSVWLTKFLSLTSSWSSYNRILVPSKKLITEWCLAQPKKMNFACKSKIFISSSFLLLKKGKSKTGSWMSFRTIILEI